MILSSADRPMRTGGFGGGGSPPPTLMISRRPRRPAENNYDFLNDFPPAGEAGGKIINDFLNDFPPARAAGGKMN